MTVFRVTALLLALGLLAACDEQAQPAAPPPTPPRTEVVPVPEPEPPVSVPAEPAVRVPAASQPAVSAKPAAVQSPPPQKQPVRAKVQAPPVAKPQPLPQVKLDLRLPAELVEQMEFEPLEELPAEPLLPPLFVEKPSEPGPFQLNGRLITNDQNVDYWDSVEGAELQFEFRN